MFKVRQISQRASRNLINNNKTFNAVSRFQAANMHDFTLKVAFPVENLESFKTKIETAAEAEHQETSDFQVTYFDSVPQNKQLTPDAAVAQNVELYTLSKKDIWLKQLNNVWHCMCPHADTAGITHLNQQHADRIPHYDEQHSEKEIRRMLNLQQDLTKEAREGIKLPTLAEDLKTRMGVVPYASFKYAQATYALPEHFLLDLYSTDFGYNVVYLQSIVRNGTELDLANRCTSLMNVLQKIDVDIQSYSFTRTMILEFIKRNNPEQWKVLVDGGVVPRDA